MGIFIFYGPVYSNEARRRNLWKAFEFLRLLPIVSLFRPL
jgi:hypothetical protein